MSEEKKPVAKKTTTKKTATKKAPAKKTTAKKVKEEVAETPQVEEVVAEAPAVEETPKAEEVSVETPAVEETEAVVEEKAPAKAERMTSPDEDTDFDWEIYEMGSVEYTDDVRKELEKDYETALSTIDSEQVLDRGLSLGFCLCRLHLAIQCLFPSAARVCRVDW